VVSAGGTVVKSGTTYDIPASLGTTRGANLFQTFVQFDLAQGEVANFGGAAGISNILARVTGSRSFIDGTIHSTTPNVKLFLMNSKGVTFEEHAHLDINGSFAVTTADVIKLSDGGRFDAVDPTKDSLTAGAISAYGFLGQQANTLVVNAGTTLTGATGQTLSFVGGPVLLKGGDTVASAVNLQAPQGRLEVASVTKGDLKLSLAPGPTMGAVSMRNANLDADTMAIRAGTLAMSQVTGQTTGAFDVQVRGVATLADGTSLGRQTSGTKPTGNFSIRGGVVQLTGASEIGSTAPLGAPAGSKAGKVSVVAGRLVVREGSGVRTSTSGAGGAGAIDVRATQIYTDGAGAIQPTGIFSTSLPGGVTPGGVSFPPATGPSGAVSVRAAGSLTLVNGGSISADTSTVGRAGNVSVQAKNIYLANAKSTQKTGIFSDSFSPGLSGHGGDVHVAADTLEIRGGGLISTKTIGSGGGGDTFVDVRKLTIDASDAPLTSFSTGTPIGAGGVIGPTKNGFVGPEFTGIAADSASAESTLLPAHAAGAGGDVHVRADLVRITGGGQISATTATKGQGGSVFVDARKIILEGHRGLGASSISAESLAQAGAGGAGGSVVVTADNLTITNGARISATTFGAGKAGEVQVTAGTAMITSQAGGLFTGILAVSASATLPGASGSVRAQFGTLEISGGGAIAGNTLGPGRGGDVIIIADTARLLSGGQISADTSGLGLGGSIDLTASDLLISGGGLRPTGIFSGSSAIGIGGPAGSVHVAANTAQLMDGGTIGATSASSGVGGSVVVEATQLLLDGASSIAASATGLGFAGSVNLMVEDPLFLRGGSSVRTTSALSDAGTVSVTSASSIIMENSSITVQALLGNAGSIALTAQHMLSMQNSQLIAEAGMNGGNISVDPDFIVLDHSRISANAVMTGGNILLSARNFLPSETPVTATGSTAGTVQISAPQLDLSGALAALNGQLVDASIRFQERCAMRLGGEVSSFLVLGRGGVEDFPGNPPLVLSRRTAPAPARPR
jgi:filamentous hemagglutinin family protein